MPDWSELERQAPRITEVFRRRHATTDRLCMLGTLRPDGYPRVSPMEPAFFEGDLWIGGIPGTAKFEDLLVDPRFTLHTATIDPHVGEGDAKVWGSVEDVHDEALHQRYAAALYAETGFDLRGRTFDHFFRADIVGLCEVGCLSGCYSDHSDTQPPHPGENGTMPRQLTPISPAELTAALASYDEAGPDGPGREVVRVLVKHYLALLQRRAPGASVEVRVPPYSAVQVIPGVRHTRGTPPAVVELDATTWIEVARGQTSWADATAKGAVRASGERTDLSRFLPLTGI